MVKHQPSSLLVTRSHYEQSPEYLSKLIRGILYGERITNRQFHERYRIAFPPEPGVQQRNTAALISARCADIYNNEKFMSYYIFSSIVDVLGFDIKEMSVTIQSEDRTRTLTFSTAMSLKDIDDMCGGAGGDSMITPEKYKTTPGDLSKLIRGILYGLKITRKNFQTLYREKYDAIDALEKRNGSARISAFNLSINSDVKAISFYLFESVLRVIRWRVVTMAVTLEERVTKDIRSYSTAQSAEDIDTQVAQENMVGISSL